MMNNHIFDQFSIELLFLLTFVLILLPGDLTASEAGHAETTHGEEPHRKHTIGLFLGITHEHHEQLETVGIEYSYRINKHWSLGGVIERAERDDDSTLAIFFVHFWPYKGLYLGGGIGRKDPGDKRQNTFRATVGYEFEFGKGWILSPQVNLDFIEDEEREEVYGVVFGRQF
jgi:hypothetical protein